MSKIPETRLRTVDNLPNDYYEGYLDEHDAAVVVGFDGAVTAAAEELLSQSDIVFNTIKEKTDNPALKGIIDQMSQKDKDDFCELLTTAFIEVEENERELFIYNSINEYPPEKIEEAVKRFEAGERNELIKSLMENNIVDANGEYLDADDPSLE